MERGRQGITPSHFTGLIAVAVSATFLVLRRGDLSIVAASIYFLLACTTDTFKSKIPNLLNLSMLFTGLVINSVTFGWHGTMMSLAGAGLGIALLLLPYLLGGMGAGDVKALGALGALLGPLDLLHVFVYMGLYGGAFALLHYLARPGITATIRHGWHSVCAFALTQKAEYILPGNHDPGKKSLRFPYSSAIALGYYSFIYWGGVL